MLDPVETCRSLTRYRTEFGRSGSNGVGVSRGPEKFWGYWGPAHFGWDVAARRNTPPTCYRAKYGRSRSNGRSVFTEIHRKQIDPARPAFQGHPMSLELTGIDWPCDFLLVIPSNRRPVSYRFRDKLQFLGENRKFSHPVYLTPPLRGLPLEFCIGDWEQYRILRA